MGRWRRTGRRALRAVFAAMAALVLLVGVLRANARYFYCPQMDAVASHACCASEHRGSEAPAADAPECCEVHRIGALPAADGASAVEVASSPLLAVLPAAGVVARRSAAAVREARLEARHRGPPMVGAARARSMVFLI